MNWKINDLLEETKAPLRRGYWKITSVSLLMIILSFGVTYSSLINSVNEIPELVRNIISTEVSTDGKIDTRMALVLLTMAGGILILYLMIKVVMDIFLENPLQVGAARMFLNTMDDQKPVLLADILYAYDSDYLNTVKVLFTKWLYRDLWLLLFIVPGMIKAYEYMMIPYLLSEDPYMDKKEAFAKSKELMNGNKKKAFLLDLYFLPWHFLGMITLGIAEVFYVAPKKNMVKACFYLKLKEMNQNQKGEEN